MKKFFIICAGVLLLVVAAHYFLHQAHLLTYSGRIIEGLTHDLADFYGEHERLPATWTEFASWSNDRNGPNHWVAAELQSLFALKWNATVKPDAPPGEKLFVVLDRRDFAGIETTVNNRLYVLCLNSIPLHQDKVSHP